MRCILEIHDKCSLPEHKTGPTYNIAKPNPDAFDKNECIGCSMYQICWSVSNMESAIDNDAP
jgi:hypothetical protein